MSTENSERIIHLSEYSSQPDILLVCGEWGIPSWSQPKNLPEDVHMLDNGKFYTFDKNKFNCHLCKTKASKDS